MNGWQGAIVAAGWCLLAGAGAAAEPDARGLELFEKRIRPVLVKHCYKCHSAEAGQTKGNFALDSRDGIRRGGETGPAVVPGDVASSLLIEAIRYESLEMPPDGQLPNEVIADFVRWIELGAPDPREGVAGLIRREINFEEGRRHWAFQPPRKTAPPAVRDVRWPRDEIDRFVLARLEENGLSPVGDADRAALVRRVYFDLIGLPPTPEQVEAFVSDDSPQAMERLVDELLASLHFGERWGRHWLDIARYGESNGRERNFLYPHAWRYRDYVIRSFNQDKPYDQFIREQIAGDLLPAEDPAVRDERLIATGFLAIGPKLLNERNREVFLMDVVDEQVDVTTRAFLSLTVACARCHDHKFDPIPTSEYYALAGIFRSSETLFSTGGGQGVRQKSQLHSLASGAAEADEAARAQHADQIAGVTAELQTAERELKRLQALGKQKKKKNAGADDSDPRADEVRRQMAQLKRKVGELRERLADLEADPPRGAAGSAMGMAEGQVGDVRICIRGEVDDRGELVRRGYLTILSPGEPPKVESQGSGRLELAGWIASADNPLTARTAVNRIWQHLFGYGLVRTTDNFGATGEAPTHPELLDHLAVSFVEDGWSVKRMIRRIVLSRTYGLSNEFSEGNYERDPENRLLWRANSRRLDAEALRDAMLAASGQLEPTPAEGSVVARYGEDQGIGTRGVNEKTFDVASRHRSVYLPIVRNAVPTSLAVFDFAEPSIIVGERSVTTVPAQALYMMNNPFVIEQSDHTAKRLLKADAAARIELAYKLILCRNPVPAERERAAAYVSEMLAQLGGGRKGDEAARQRAYSALCQALFASAEFRYLE